MNAPSSSKPLYLFEFADRPNAPMSLHRVLPIPLNLSNTDLAQRWSASSDALKGARIMTDRKAAVKIPSKRIQVQTPPRQIDSPPLEARPVSVSPDEDSLEDYEASINGINTPTKSRKRELSSWERSHSFVPEESASSICLCQPDPKVPRPRNAFILYRQHHQASVVAQNPGLANPQISKVIGDHWRTAPDEIKNHWRLLAEEEKVRHQKQHPGYRYQPRKTNRANSVSTSVPPTKDTDLPLARCTKCGGRSISTSTMISNVSSHQASPHAHGHRASQPSYQAQHSPLRMTSTFSDPSLSSATASRFARSIGSPQGAHQNGHLPNGYRYLPQKPLPLTSPHSKRSMVRDVEFQDQAEHAQRSPDLKRRRTNNNVAFVATRGPSGPLSPLSLPSYGQHSRRQSLPRLESLGPSLHSPFKMAPPPRERHHPRPEKGLTLPPLQKTSVPTASIAPPNGVVDGPRTLSSDSQARSLEAMILSIPILNKIKVLARISAPIATGSSTSTSPATPALSEPAGRRGLVIALDAADSGARKQLTQTLVKALREDCDVKVFQVPSAPGNGSPQQTFQSYLRLVDEYHTLSKQIREHVAPSTPTIRNVSSPRSSSMTPAMRKIRQASESPVSPKSFPRQAPASSTANENHSDSNGIIAQNDGKTMQDENEDTILTDANASDNDHDDQQQEHSPSPAMAPLPVALLPAWQLTHTDAFACSVDILDRYSPVDHWQWGATVWRGVIGADITVAVKPDTGDESPAKPLPAAAVAPTASTTAAADGPPTDTNGTGKPPVRTLPAVATPAGLPGPTTSSSSNIIINNNNNNGNINNNNNNNHNNTWAPSVGVEMRLDDARAVIVKGDGKGGVPEGSLRRVGFEVGEWVRGWADREEMRRRGNALG